MSSERRLKVIYGSLTRHWQEAWIDLQLFSDFRDSIRSFPVYRFPKTVVITLNAG